MWPWNDYACFHLFTTETIFQGQKEIAIVTFLSEYFSSYHNNKPVIDHCQLKKSHCKKQISIESLCQLSLEKGYTWLSGWMKSLTVWMQ